MQDNQVMDEPLWMTVMDIELTLLCCHGIWQKAWPVMGKHVLQGYDGTELWFTVVLNFGSYCEWWQFELEASCKIVCFCLTLLRQTEYVGWKLFCVTDHFEMERMPTIVRHSCILDKGLRVMKDLYAFIARNMQFIVMCKPSSLTKHVIK